VGLGWAQALLVGAILAPTDPVFASALVGNEKVPARLRHLLNVESGVNDGLALPFVIVFLAVAAGSDELHLGELALEGSDEIFHLVALTIVLSILLHSSTDVVVARRFDEHAETPAWHGILRRSARAARR
jgi:NhaP-type Na+/H+ or K+/H+ antiporter